MNGPVVVGVDGSPSGLDAVEAAAWEADRRGVGLELAHALTWSEELVPAGVAPWDPDGGGLRDRVNEALADAEWRARRVAPHLAITREVLVGEAATVLWSASRSASLTVVGSHPAHGVRGRLHGSVADRLTARAGCPVLVMCGRQSRTGPVVLAQDEAAGDREAAEFAGARRRNGGAAALCPAPTAGRSCGTHTAPSPWSRTARCDQCAGRSPVSGWSRCVARTAACTRRCTPSLASSREMWFLTVFSDR